MAQAKAGFRDRGDEELARPRIFVGEGEELQKNVYELKKRLASAESAITKLKTSVSALQAKIDDHEARIYALENP